MKTEPARADRLLHPCDPWMPRPLAPCLRSALLLGLLSPGALEPPQRTEVEALVRADATAEVLKVVDGDTLDVRLDGAEVTLRLLSVDTEEKITGRAGGSPSKPQTVFGQETALWAREFFAALDQPVRIGLAFPEGRRLDVYGRLLCEVLLPDGRDFNLLLVKLGKSPYFNKYGNSRLDHGAFQRAQAEAQRNQLGIWNPATNRAKTPGAPSAVRPYDRLLPWWEARAAAIDRFRERVAREPERRLFAEDTAALGRGHRACREDPTLRVTVFAAIERFYDEADGSLTVLLENGNAAQSLRASVPREQRSLLEDFLRASTAEFRQNYLSVEGSLGRNARGFLLSVGPPADWRTAEPEFPAREPPREK